MLFPNLVTYHVYDGCFLPPFAAQAYQYILAGDGIFVRAETPRFSAIVPVAACSERRSQTRVAPGDRMAA